MTKIEEVAKAIYLRMPLPKFLLDGEYARSLTWEECDETFREKCRDLARASIKAMRKPTKAMLQTIALPQIDRIQAADWWRAMIDEALKEQSDA